jgi:photosystem II stability/assembly factor-like uncharacterized protein
MRMKVVVAVVLTLLMVSQAGTLIGQPAPKSDSPGAQAGVSPDMFAGLEYRMVGPSRGGRATAVAGHRAQPSTFYQGATGGGVWKTTDYGQTWFPISDGYFATGSIGAIRVADSDPNIVYVSTGSDGLRSNVIIGKGVYKSTNAGRSWEHIGLEDTGNSGAVLIHPDNPDLVYVAAIGNPFAPNAERGVYRTRNGGASWELVLFVSDKTGAVDLEFAPDNPDEVYASMWRAERKPWTIISGDESESGVYKSSDGGNSWAQLTNGLPSGLRGKSDLAVSAADPDRVYVLIEAPADEGGLFRSDDRGATWRQVSDYQPMRNRPFYYNNLDANPKDPDMLWAQAEGYFKSVDGGVTWQRGSTPHGDNHDLWINPDDPNLMVQSNDGGANVTRDGGQTWSTILNQPTAELYQVDISDDFPYRLYAGQQDNSTISVPSFPPFSAPGGHMAHWEDQGGCETGPAIPKPGDPDIVYADCKGRFGVYNRRTGQEQQYYVGFWNLYGRNPKDLAYRFQRVAPIAVSPHNPNRVYHTSQYVHVTENGGRTWETISPDLTAFTPETQVISGTPITLDVTGEEHFSVIYEIQESPHEVGVIWVGANDGPIQLTRDNGLTWKDVTPAELGPYGRVQNIEVSPHDPAKAYATVLRYLLGDFEPYAFKTEDYGESWTRISTGSNGIPNDYPVRVVREDPDREGLLYAGTEFGMFISFDDGGNWQPFQLNLPVTPITDMKVVNQDLAISTMGRSFWILSDLTRLHELSDEIATSNAHLFQIRDPYRLRGGGGFMGFRRNPRPDEPQYPPVGANIDYWLDAEPAGDVRLEILDARGHLIREFSSASPAQIEVSDRPGEPIPDLAAAGTPRLPKSAGIHRVVWDLHHPGPWASNQGQAGRGGPMVPPGKFQARLTVGDWSSTVAFEALTDPRVVREGITADLLTEQTNFALSVRDTLSIARHAADVLQRMEREVEGAETASAEDLAAQLEAIHTQLLTAPRRYSPPMLLDQLQYLYGNLSRADQAPGDDAYTRHDELGVELEDLIGDLERVLRTMQN